MENLKVLGFNKWFEDKKDYNMLNSHKLARVIIVNKNNYVVSDGKREINAGLTGKFMFNSESALDYPAVGDWVYIQLFDDDTLAVIHEIFPRKSVLKRKTSGKNIDYQLIAANIDTAIIMQALDNNFNLRRLERYMVMVNESGIKPVLFLSKTDLLEPHEIESRIKEINNIFPGIKIEAFSNNRLTDIENIKTHLTPCETFCLLGSSGVGKSTLINNLVHQNLFKTQQIREKDGRGKHTTTHRELILLDNGAIIIDNPGMRELGVISVEAGLNDTFAEITALADKCLFDDCTHTIEKGCAVLKALEDGAIEKDRYGNFIKMYKESLYNEMSYFEKRQKEKKFGKYIHSVMKHKKDKRK